GFEHLGPFAHFQAILASTGVILAALYMLSVVQKVFFGPLSNPKNKHLPDMNARELFAISPLVGLIFIIGFFPSLFLDRMGPSVEAVLDRYREHRQEFTAQEENSEARLMGRRGGPLEIGYPEAPKSDAEKTAQASKNQAEEKAQ